jgi:hypothetical protein
MVRTAALIKMESELQSFFESEHVIRNKHCKATTTKILRTDRFDFSRPTRASVMALLSNIA